MPVVGYNFTKGGHLKIRREDIKKAIGVLDVAADMMKAGGKSVAIAPEGTRRRSNSIPSGDCLIPFKKGPFHMAKRAERDILIVSFQGARRLAAGLLYKSGTIRMTIGNRIPKEEVLQLPVEDLMEKTRKNMVDLMRDTPDSYVFYSDVPRYYRLYWLIPHVIIYLLVNLIFF